jgi:hypothetical protein
MGVLPLSDIPYAMENGVARNSKVRLLGAGTGDVVVLIEFGSAVGESTDRIDGAGEPAFNDGTIVLDGGIVIALGAFVGAPLGEIPLLVGATVGDKLGPSLVPGGRDIGGVGAIVGIPFGAVGELVGVVTGTILGPSLVPGGSVNGSLVGKLLNVPSLGDEDISDGTSDGYDDSNPIGGQDILPFPFPQFDDLLFPIPPIIIPFAIGDGANDGVGTIDGTVDSNATGGQKMFPFPIAQFFEVSLDNIPFPVLGPPFIIPSIIPLFPLDFFPWQAMSPNLPVPYRFIQSSSSWSTTLVKTFFSIFGSIRFFRCTFMACVL